MFQKQPKEVCGAELARAGPAIEAVAGGVGSAQRCEVAAMMRAAGRQRQAGRGAEAAGRWAGAAAKGVLRAARTEQRRRGSCAAAGHRQVKAAARS